MARQPRRISRSEPRRVPPSEVGIAIRHATGVAELAMHVGSEIVSLTQEVHAAWSPVSWASGHGPARGIYGGVRLGFRGAGRLAALGGRLAGAESDDDDAGLDVRSALNGAFGHLYERAGSAYALPMTLHRARGRRRAGRLVVFVHGLCTHERVWRGPAHARFGAWARRRLGADVAHLRYNTGLHISTNGERLARLLEAELQAGAHAREPREIVLVGHSMGGLVALSAVHHAERAGLAWPRRLRRLACLGSPHEGTTWERLGNHANRLLRGLPWTRPFMRLGELRSDGIRDLRFGHLAEADWRHRAPDDPRPSPTRVVPARHVDHLFVAASRSARGERDPLGDWLVPVPSALARNLHGRDAARRVLIPELDHLGLLSDERVYRVLRRWLDQPASAPSSSSWM